MPAAHEIVVPGSVANLGGGFDTLAVAVQLYLRARIVEVRESADARLVVVTSRPAVTGENAVERAYRLIAERTGRRAPSVFVEVESDIPVAAGLGSSAAAAVAGLRVFERVTSSVLPEVLLATATELEGHADNAAASLYGGLTSVVESDGRNPTALQWRWPEDVRLVVATPAVGLATSKARAVLPEMLPRVDAVFNLQRVLSLIHALQTGDTARLRQAVMDRWHQPARAALVPQLTEVLALDDPDVLGAFLAGAGPSVAILARGNVARVARLLGSIYERASCPVTIRTLGVHQSFGTVPSAFATAQGRTV
jgi:homoserine kinase